MRKCDKAGFTSTELIVVFVVMWLLAVVLYGVIWFSDAVSGAKYTGIKNRARGILSEVLSANAEREPLGLSSVWPKDLGFDASRTSTDYFRQLMSDDPVTTSDGVRHPICEGLHAQLLGGDGIPCASTRETFTSANNAWKVLCVSAQTPPEVTFLVRDNIDMGRHVNALSLLKINHNAPSMYKRDRRCIYATCGGAIMDRREKFMYAQSGFSYVLESIGTNTTYDVMKP